MKTEGYRSGFVAVIGRPNAGKSTLLNQLLGEKLVIVTDKPQTTRNKINCILTRDDAQVVFIDTPGLHKPQTKLGEYMVDTVREMLAEVDAILLLVDAAVQAGTGDRFVVESLQAVKAPVFLGLNKIDLVAETRVKELTELYRGWRDFAGIFPISAQKGTNLTALLDAVIAKLPPGPQYYPDDMVIDQPERFIVAELIREKVMEMTQEEVPHAVAVAVEEMAERSAEQVYVRAVIYVERESQKGIIIGAGGARLKEIGRRARHDAEGLLGSHVYLDLWVKVKKDWRKKDSALREFGYE